MTLPFERLFTLSLTPVLVALSAFLFHSSPSDNLVSHSIFFASLYFHQFRFLVSSIVSSSLNITIWKRTPKNYIIIILYNLNTITVIFTKIVLTFYLNWTFCSLYFNVFTTTSNWEICSQLREMKTSFWGFLWVAHA